MEKVINLVALSMSVAEQVWRSTLQRFALIPMLCILRLNAGSFLLWQADSAWYTSQEESKLGGILENNSSDLSWCKFRCFPGTTRHLSPWHWEGDFPLLYGQVRVCVQFCARNSASAGASSATMLACLVSLSLKMIKTDKMGKMNWF